jgi:tripartite-type tricarboxylate transporter receptor subunit TctC
MSHRRTAASQRRGLLVAALAVGVLAGLVPVAQAQTWPARPIRLVVGYPPGGAGDFVTRLIGDELARELGVSVVVDNRPGAAGALAGEVVAKAPADGYTLLSSGHHAILQALYPRLGFDPERDFTPISLVATGPTVLCVNNDLPVHTLPELVAYARARPGQLFHAGSGNGSAPHLAATTFETIAGIKFTSIQFKGGGAAAQSLIAGDTQVMFATPPTVMQFIKAGRMRALAISARKASAAVPGIPGAEEAGLPGYESTFWFGLMAPTGTPPAAIQRVHAAAQRGLARPEVRARIASQGMDATPSASPQAFAAQIRDEAPMWARVVKESGARAD